ncbi:hypothetical protein LCGC14_1633500 [marine sediment metagenome]|uniref:NAD(P)-binding domain-containing protein n=1 Tax=marine sediment metagenome TaxID=412755 RepID=A0A0F9I293_9ZZZZ
MANDIHAVTGAFGYSGGCIARRLLEGGCRVITLTNSPNKPDPFDGKVRPVPFHFDRPEKLIESLKGVAVLYNTYWVRFNYRRFSHARAVRNSSTLFEAAARAGVGRVVHVSITNPSESSPLEYFRGKARIEKALVGSGISHAILRPAVLFGEGDILINNTAWVLRTLPAFGMFGDGRYRLQPIHVADLARLAVEQGARRDDCVINAIGPETFTYRGLVEALRDILGVWCPIISVPPLLGLAAARVLGMLVRDVVVTREEIAGLMADLLYVDAPPAGETRLTDWARRHADTLGRHYASELARRQGR